MGISPEKEPRTTLIAGVSPVMLDMAHKLTLQGERVVFFFRSKEKLQELIAKVTGPKDLVLPLVASVTDGKAVIKAYEKLIKWTRRLDCLIYNVGIEPSEATQAFSGAEFVRVIGLNFYGFVNCFSLALPLFKRVGRGHAIAVCGPAALSLESQPAAYAASRAALQIYVRTLRRELSGNDIAITELYLGRVPMARGTRKPREREVVEGILQVLRSRPAKHVIGIP